MSFICICFRIFFICRTVRYEDTLSWRWLWMYVHTCLLCILKIISIFCIFRIFWFLNLVRFFLFVQFAYLFWITILRNFLILIVSTIHIIFIIVFITVFIIVFLIFSFFFFFSYFYSHRVNMIDQSTILYFISRVLLVWKH